MNKTVQKIATWAMVIVMFGGFIAIILAYLIK